MPDLCSNVVALLRAELKEEVAAGFPRLNRIPQTDIIWFLDHFASLGSAEREALLEALTRSAAMAFFPRQGAGLAESDPVLERFREIRSRAGSKGGTRYTDVKMLSMDPSFREPAGYHESWREMFTALHFQPRSDLLPDLSQLKPAKAPLLRKLVNAALARLFEPKKEKQPGGACKYVGPYGDSELIVWVDWNSRLGQLCYEVSLKNAAFRLPVIRLSYERLWAVNLGWDYLTEENAARAIDFFAVQVVYLAALAARVNSLGDGGS